MADLSVDDRLASQEDIVVPDKGKNIRRVVARVDQVMVLAVRVLLVMSVLAELCLVVGNVFDREVLHGSLSWELPGAELALLAIGFLGGAVAYCNGQHISVDYFTRRVGESTQAIIRTAGQWLAIGLASLTCIWSIQNYHLATLGLIAGANISTGIYAVLFAVGMGLIVIDTTVKLLDNSRIQNIVGLAIVAGLTIVVFVIARISWISASADHVLVVSAVLALVVILAGLPLTMGLLLFLANYIVGGHNVTAFVPLGAEDALSNVLLLAIPFFVLAGYLMTDGGLAKAIVDLLARPLRRLPGGNMQLTVGTMFVFSGMTGAKIADVTAVGSAMTDSLVEDGFDRGEIACVLASCASAGETIPPSIALLILGSVTSISISTLFIAGIVPALLVVVSLSTLIALRDRLGLMRSKNKAAVVVSTVPLGRRLRRGTLALGLPVVLLGGLESGLFTATEASAIAVLYAVCATCISRPRLGLHQLWNIAERSAAMAGLLLLLVSIATTVAQSTVIAGVPQEIAKALSDLGNSSVIFIIITLAVVPIAGVLLEGIPAIVIFAPLFVPTAQQLGINLVHYGILFILALGLGAFSPLLGVGFYVSCKVAGADVSEATRHYFPYLAAIVVAVLIVAFVPAVTLAFPHWLHYAGS